MAIEQRMSEQEYERFVLSGIKGTWELHAGRLVEKPALSEPRGTIVSRLAQQLLAQLNAGHYQVRINAGFVRAPEDTILIPDLLVAPTAFDSPAAGRVSLAIHAEPLPLIVEVWGPSDADYDVAARIPIYQQRSDLEIWRIHPADRTLTTCVRQPDGTYAETIYQPGAGWPVARFSVPPTREPSYHA
jgi:Uma2 family endonuclease